MSAEVLSLMAQFVVKDFLNFANFSFSYSVVRPMPLAFAARSGRGTRGSAFCE